MFPPGAPLQIVNQTNIGDEPRSYRPMSIFLTLSQYAMPLYMIVGAATGSKLNGLRAFHEMESAEKEYHTVVRRSGCTSYEAQDAEVYYDNARRRYERMAFSGFLAGAMLPLCPPCALIVWFAGSTA